MATDYEVTIVGAGAIGCCTARNIVSDHDVLVLAKDQIEDSASANASAFISDWWYFLQGDCVPGAFNVVRDFFHELDGTCGFEFNEHPYLRLIDEEERRSGSDDRVKRMRDSAEQVKSLAYYTKDELLERWSKVLNLDGFEGGIVDERAGYIAPKPYLEAMKTEAEERGAEFRFGAEVTEITTEDNGVPKITIDNSETIRSEKVIVAAGSHTSQLVAEFTNLPTLPFMICGHRLEPNHEPADSVPITTGRGMFVGPDAFGSLTLAGGEYWIDDPEHADSFSEEFPDRAHEHVVEQLPHVLKGYESENDIRYRSDGQHRCPEGITITPDQLPVIDTVDRQDNIIVADGSRGAVSLAPAITSVVRSLVTGEETRILHDPFEIGRFDNDTVEFDLPLITDPPA